MKSATQTGRGNGSPSRPATGGLRRATARRGKPLAVAAMALLFSLTACDNDYTLSYVYAPSETAGIAGLINAYGVDNQTGALRLLPDSPIPSGGRNPVAIAATPPDTTRPQAVYVINHDDSTVVELTIGTDGKLYPQHTYNTTGTGADGTVTSGSYPVALAVSPDGNTLYVAYTYQLGFTTASPGPGGIIAFRISAQDRSLGSALNFPIGRSPVAITVGPASNAVYVIAQDASAVNPAAGQPVASHPSDQSLNLFAFAADTSTGALSPLPGQTISAGNVPSFGFPTGVTPSGILVDASGTHLYVTDAGANEVIPYALDATGAPSLIVNPLPLPTGETTVFFSAPTGTQPMGMSIDPSGTYLFVANYISGSVSEYTFGSSGEPIPSTTATSTEAGTGTTCVAVEPTRGTYLYASGRLSNSITGEQLIVGDGSLKPIIGSPYEAAALPVCAVAVRRFQ